jgi:hypothetical protein
MKYFKHLITLLLLLTIQELSQAQDLGRKKEKEKKKIQDLFLKDLPWKTTEDSTMLIGFSFKISVQKNANGLTKPITIIASDTLAYKIFPNYTFLTTINYELFLKERNEGVFIIPILIEMVGSQSEEFYTKEKQLDFMNKNISGRSMFDSALSLLNIHNLDQNNGTENYIYLEPVFIWMDRRINNY